MTPPTADYSLPDPAAVGMDPVMGSPLDRERHEAHWVSRVAAPLVSVALLLSLVVLGFTVSRGWYWLAIPLLLLTSHLMHGALIGFHEASHGMLRKSRRLNDLNGIIAGIFSFMSFTLYRAAHQKHHMYLATERDEELWPFVNVNSPRWARRLAAFLELNAGMIFTPFLFWRMFFREGSFIRSPKVRRKIWQELILVVSAWVAILSAVTWFHVWHYFFWLYLAPGFLAGNMQSWRKYIEHVGLSGHTAKSATRAIIADSWHGHLISLTLLHEPFHAVHHLRSGLPHYELPQHAPLLEPSAEGELKPFPNYRSAIMHLFRQLPDPRVGSHWPDSPAKKTLAAGSSH